MKIIGVFLLYFLQFYRFNKFFVQTYTFLFGIIIVTVICKSKMKENIQNKLKNYSELINGNIGRYNHLLTQINMAASYVALHNYPQAYNMLINLENKIIDNRVIKNSQNSIVYIKVQSYLCLLQITGANQEQAHYRLDLVIKNIKKQSQHCHVFMGLVTKILLGHQQFNEITNESALRLQSTDLNEQQEPNPMILSLAISQELIGSEEQSYQLSYRFYTLAKKRNHTVFLLLSSKYLSYLAQKLCLSKNIQDHYNEEYQRILELAQFYGMSEETIFRNYQQRIQTGCSVIQKLLNFQKQIKSEIKQEDTFWLRKAILKKIQIINPYSQNLENHSLYKDQNNSYIGNCSVSTSATSMSKTVGKLEYNLKHYDNKQTCKKSIDCLLMSQSNMIKNIKQQMKTKLQRLVNKLSRYPNIMTKKVWGMMLMLPPNIYVPDSERATNQEGYEYFNLKQSKKQKIQEIEESLQFSRKINELPKFNILEYPDKNQHLPPKQYLIPKSRSVSPRIQRVNLNIYQRQRHIQQKDDFEIEQNKSKIYRKKGEIRRQIRHNRNITVSIIRNPVDKNEGKNIEPKSNKIEMLNTLMRKPEAIGIKQQGSSQQQIQIKSKLRQNQSIIPKITKNMKSQVPSIHQTNPQLQPNNKSIVKQSKPYQGQSSLSKSFHKTNSLLIVHKPQKQSIKKSTQKHLLTTTKHNQLKKFVKICCSGQYFIKRHYSSDGGEEKFVKIQNAMIKWAINEEKMLSSYQSYKLKDIKGVAYGHVSKTFLKDCNKKLEPWRCFSLILQKRTLDLYCCEQIDPFIWLPGISSMLEGQIIKTKDLNVAITTYSPGRVLWKRMLMKLKYLYIPNDKKKKNYNNANAYAIIQFGKSGMKADLSKLNKQKKKYN